MKTQSKAKLIITENTKKKIKEIYKDSNKNFENMTKIDLKKYNYY